MSIPPHSGGCAVDGQGCLNAPVDGGTCWAVFDAALPSTTASLHAECSLHLGSDVAYVDMHAFGDPVQDELLNTYACGVGFWDGGADVLLEATDHNICDLQEWTPPSGSVYDVHLDCQFDSSAGTASATVNDGNDDVGSGQCSAMGTPGGTSWALEMQNATCCVASSN